MYPLNCANGKQRTINLIGGQRKVCGMIFFAVRGEIDWEWVFADGSYVRAHQHASGAKTGEDRAIGRSRGGLTTKIHMVADAHGNPIYFEITGGQVHESQIAEQLIKAVPQAENFIADKGYDSDKIRENARENGITPVIPRRLNAKKANPEFDKFESINLKIDA